MKPIFKAALLLNIIICLPLLGHAQCGTHKVKLTLLSGMQTMEYRYMLFKTHKGDTLCAPILDSCLTSTGKQYIWTSDGPPVYIKAEFKNKQFKVTYTPSTDTIIYAKGQPTYSINIKKMKLLK